MVCKDTKSNRMQETLAPRECVEPLPFHYAGPVKFPVPRTCPVSALVCSEPDLCTESESL